MLLVCIFEVIFHVFIPFGIGLFLSFFGARAGRILRFLTGAIFLSFLAVVISTIVNSSRFYLASAASDGDVSRFQTIYSNLSFTNFSGGYILYHDLMKNLHGVYSLLLPVEWALWNLVGGLLGVIFLADPFRHDFGDAKNFYSDSDGFFSRWNPLAVGGNIPKRPRNNLETEGGYELASPTGSPQSGPMRFGMAVGGSPRALNLNSTFSNGTDGGKDSSNSTSPQERPTLNLGKGGRPLLSTFESPFLSKIIVPGVLGLLVVEIISQFLSLIMRKTHAMNTREPIYDLIGFVLGMLLWRFALDVKTILATIASLLGSFLMVAAANEASELYVEPGQRNSINLLENFLFLRIPRQSGYDAWLAENGTAPPGISGTGIHLPGNSHAADSMHLTDELASKQIPNNVKEHFVTFLLISIFGPKSFLLNFDMDAPFIFIGICWKLYALIVYNSIGAQQIVIQEREQETQMDVNNLLGGLTPGGISNAHAAGSTYSPAHFNPAVNKKVHPSSPGNTEGNRFIPAHVGSIPANSERNRTPRGMSPDRNRSHSPGRDSHGSSPSRGSRDSHDDGFPDDESPTAEQDFLLGDPTEREYGAQRHRRRSDESFF